MPDDRTTVTELGTALGMLPFEAPAAALAARPPELAVADEVWDRLSALQRGGHFAEEFAAAWANGRAFLQSPEALRGRPPLLVEWTGGRRPPGDEVAPVDLRIDHVYLVSCKYLSRTIANASPARLFDGLLTTTGDWSTGDWYQEVAPGAYRRLYGACREAAGLGDLPEDPSAMSRADRRRLRLALPERGAYPPSARAPYAELCREVSEASAKRWAHNASRARAQERLVWRLLRMGNASYYVLGADPHRPLRLRVASPWDWRQAYQLVSLDIRPAEAGQPQVDWTVTYRARCGTSRLRSIVSEAGTPPLPVAAAGQSEPLVPGAGQPRTVRGHVEVRWSHGRFAQPPEAKVYIDTPTDRLPGYFPIDAPSGQAHLWE